jgi:CheY-like chemotaxis protein
MLKILIVEDDKQLSSMLKYLVEDNPRYRVVGIAEDATGALATAEEQDPDLALVDLHLAHGSTGYGVAARLNDNGIPCMFVTGRAPGFAMPDLALGCLMKPFTGDDVHRALAMAEDVMRGRETHRPRTPKNFELYNAEADRPAPEAASPAPVPEAPRPTLSRRLAAWVAGTVH